MQPYRWLAVALGATTLAVAACDRSPTSASAAPVSASAAPASASAAGSGSASPRPSAAFPIPSKPASAPMPSTKKMEYAATPPDRLGRLPPGVGIAIGQPAPDAHVQDPKGMDVMLSDLMKKGAILLVFYRGGWCPYCNYEIHELSMAFPEYERRGVTPVAISVDKADEASKTEATYQIPFPVLADPDLRAHEAYRVVHKADDAEAARLRGFGIDLEASSGKTHHSFAIPALFLIDKRGVVRWAHADPDYKVRPRTPQILAAIDASLSGKK